MNIYLDTSCLKRPFDDQTQPRIRLETEALLLVLRGVENGHLRWIGSDLLLYENRNNPNAERRRRAGSILKLCSTIVGFSDSQEVRGVELAQNGIVALDALHLAAAEEAQVDVFLSCDDKLIRRASGCARVKVQNPVDFLKETDL